MKQALLIDAATLEPGDIVLVHKPNLLAWAIRAVMRLFQKDPVRFSHVLLAVEAKKGVEASTRVGYCDIPRVLKKAKAAKALRYLGGTPEKNREALGYALAHQGERYGCLRLGLQFLDQVLGTDWFTDRFPATRHVCSSLVAEAFERAYGIRFNGVEWPSVEPDDIDDHGQAHPDEWRVLWEK